MHVARNGVDSEVVTDVMLDGEWEDWDGDGEYVH